MSEFIAVQGCTISHSLGSLISGGIFTITSSPSIKVKAGGSGVYKTPLTYTFSGGNAAGFVSGTVQTTAPQTILATTIVVKADGSFVIREGDTGIMNCIGTVTPPPPGVTAPVVGSVEITLAGQIKVKAE